MLKNDFSYRCCTAGERQKYIVSFQTRLWEMSFFCWNGVNFNVRRQNKLGRSHFKAAQSSLSLGAHVDEVLSVQGMMFLTWKFRTRRCMTVVGDSSCHLCSGIGLRLQISPRGSFAAQHGQQVSRGVCFLLELCGGVVPVPKLPTWSISVPEAGWQWRDPA